jgi:mRNA interferase MazF
MPDLRRGSIVWLDFDPVRGREQSGHRPALVIASDGYLSRATSIAIVLPVTTTDRGWPNHIRLRGETLALTEPSFAMTEQPRTIDRRRITTSAGYVDDSTLRDIDVWLRDFLGL